MSKNMGKERARELRHKIAELVNEGLGVREIARRLECSPSVVSKTRAIMHDPERSLNDDRREENGAEETYTKEVHDIIIEYRKKTGFGARLIWAIMKRDPEAFGFEKPSDVPSASHINRWLGNANIINKPIGTKDTRYYPIDYTEDAGMLTIDGWGPYHLSHTERVYMVTIQDRYTRLGAAVPVNKLNNDVWIKAILVGNGHLLDGETPANTLFCDNGIGLAPAQGHTSKVLRYALASGIKRVVFSPPAQPWRNGRLENWHWRLEKEYFRTHYPKTLKQATSGVLEHINWYNIERPHGSLNYKAPADRAPWYTPLTPKGVEVTAFPDITAQAGIVEAIRLVMPGGIIETWENDKFKVASILSGQMVRVRFFLDPKLESAQQGEVIWQAGKNKEPLTIATFNHKMDRTRSRHDPLVTNLQMIDFVDDNPLLPPPPQPILTSKTKTWMLSKRTTDGDELASEARTARNNDDFHKIRTEIARSLQAKRAILLNWITTADEDAITDAKEQIKLEIENLFESAIFDAEKEGLKPRNDE